MSRTGRPATVRARIIAALLADTSGVGMTHSGLMAALGLSERGSLSSILGKAHQAGRVFAISGIRDMRYFGSEEQREACRQATEADIAKVRAHRIVAARKSEREREMRYRATSEYRERHVKLKRAARAAEKLARQTASQKPPKPRVVKPKKAKQRGPVPIMVGKMQPKRTPRPKDERPVVIPSHVKVQHCPSSKDTRYSVPAGFVGEFSKQWRELRSHTKG